MLPLVNARLFEIDCLHNCDERKTIIGTTEWKLARDSFHEDVASPGANFILGWPASETYQAKLFYSAYYQISESAYLDDMYTFIYMLRHAKGVYDIQNLKGAIMPSRYTRDTRISVLERNNFHCA